MWQTVITAAGSDNAVFAAAGFEVPKNWIPFSGTTVLQKVIKECEFDGNQIRVTIPQNEEANWIHAWAQDIPLGVSPVLIGHQTMGALCTALLAIGGLNQDLPLLVAPGDSYISLGIQAHLTDFLESGADAATIIFPSSAANMSFVRTYDSNKVAEIAEKRVISGNASTGHFMFRKTSDFVDAAEWVLTRNMNYKGEFFLSGTLNYLVMQGRNVQAQPLDGESRYVRLSTPSDLIREALS